MYGLFDIARQVGAVGMSPFPYITTCSVIYEMELSIHLFRRCQQWVGFIVWRSPTSGADPKYRSRNWSRSWILIMGIFTRLRLFCDGLATIAPDWWWWINTIRIISEQRCWLEFDHCRRRCRSDAHRLHSYNAQRRVYGREVSNSSEMLFIPELFTAFLSCPDQRSAWDIHTTWNVCNRHRD